MKNKIKKVILTILITTLFVQTISATQMTKFHRLALSEDLDPLVDVEVTVEIQKIRSLERFDIVISAYDIIDFTSDPDFYVKIFINDVEFVSDVWEDTKYIYDTPFSATFNVPDDQEFVDIKIQLWDENSNGDRLCDIDCDLGEFDVDIQYSIKTGQWTGDDGPYDSDPSGYGRVSGCDDGSIYRLNRDCELWFDVYQNDYDNDKLPYWTEVNVLATDPENDDTGSDTDEDDIPIEWEYKWGYDPFSWDNHVDIDPDDDGIENIEEYWMSEYGSDPYRPDIFVELDQMEASPTGYDSLFPEGSKELLKTAFHTHNIMFHLDDGDMGGGEMIPFDELTPRDDLEVIYDNYFLHGDENNWRRGVFRYGIVVYDGTYAGFNFGRGAFQISSSRVDKKAIPRTEKIFDVAYASVYMHELGHTLDIWYEGVDNHNAIYPWQIEYWIYGPYKSTMNYRYTYRLVDYSDGSHGPRDHDDWSNLDIAAFQRPWW